MAIKLYASGQIEFYYGNDLTEGLNWASGISNGDGGSYTIAELSNAFSIPDGHSTQFSATDFPQGMQITSDGIFSGIPLEVGETWDITFIATDYASIFSSKTIQFLALSTGISDISNNIKINLIGYPNPSSGNVTVSFELENDEFASLSIFNLNGQKICTLIPEAKLERGKHSVVWNCEDDNGNSLPIGIYYGVLSSEAYTKSVKLVLVK